jgi:hypothetical protein
MEGARKHILVLRDYGLGMLEKKKSPLFDPMTGCIYTQRLVISSLKKKSCH